MHGKSAREEEEEEEEEEGGTGCIQNENPHIGWWLEKHTSSLLPMALHPLAGTAVAWLCHFLQAAFPRDASLLNRGSHLS